MVGVSWTTRKSLSFTNIKLSKTLFKRFWFGKFGEISFCSCKTCPFFFSN